MEKKRVVVIADTGWSIGRVHRDIEAQLKDRYTFTYHTSVRFYMDAFLKDFKESDLCLSTLDLYTGLIQFIKNKEDWKKIIFICHGHSEIDKKVIYDPIISYGLTSDILVPHFPPLNNVYSTPNGVNPASFSRRQLSGRIMSIGWCGNHKIIKRFDWSYKIAEKAMLPLSVATALTYEDVRNWYHTIDILLVTSGPEEYVETGPLPPFEAIISGCVAIGTRVGNFRHVPGPKFTTIDEAASIIEDLKKNPETVKKLAEEQYDYVMKNFSYEVLAKRWEHMFEEAIARSRV